MAEDETPEGIEDEAQNPEGDGGPGARASAFMKKALTLGVGALFLTEESVRTLVGEMKLPKEILGGILESANKTRTEFLQNLSRDVREKVVEKIDPVAFLQEFLTRNDVEFTVRLNVKPKKKD